jgi:long-subunit acyl-CoA synthetase (AMP-forming)
LAVPRIWEKFEDSMKALGANAPKFIQAISNWAKAYGKEKVFRQ